MWQENAPSAELPSGDARDEVLGASKADGGGDVAAGRTRGRAAALEGFARRRGVAQGARREDARSREGFARGRRAVVRRREGFARGHARSCAAARGARGARRR
ncbi:hypothetical protein GUJ93_ZPchr0012g20403 [Zizania palustris]|uniref:Uncharacterized protein n=1 Tax=Zizania palustris TaxID=103762 RepID=A0A8J5WP85_ZIZPA|nr:hypothetical protein GUJ93_ZPchr0012g20403 [Zizania palustris]